MTAHVPHPPLKETWFGYWRDKFVKTKKYGRSDTNNCWSEENGLEAYWLSAFFNRKEIGQFDSFV